MKFTMSLGIISKRFSQLCAEMSFFTWGKNPHATLGGLKMCFHFPNTFANFLRTLEYLGASVDAVISRSKTDLFTLATV